MVTFGAQMLPELFLGNVHVVCLADALLLRFALYLVKLGIGELGGLALYLAHGPAVYGGVARKPLTAASSFMAASALP